LKRILHICGASHFSPSMTYQENYFTNIMQNAGNEVIVISSTYNYETGSLVDVGRSDLFLDNGVRLIRLAFKFSFIPWIPKKIRSLHKLDRTLNEIKPDMIFVHGFQTFDLKVIEEYKISNSHVILIADTHADHHNSARNFFSRFILHGIIYKNLIKKTFYCFDAIYGITTETIEFANELYGIEGKKIELLPLGGIVLDESVRKNIRTKMRSKLGYIDNEIVFVHSGKLDYNKRSLELARAFIKIKRHNFKLLIVGYIDNSIKDELIKLIDSDNRISYMGWKSGNELIDILHAADIYIQPGSQSATMQVAACASCALALYPHRSYLSLIEDSAYYIDGEEGIIRFLLELGNNLYQIENMRNKALTLAKNKLDYYVQTEKIMRFLE